MKSIDRINNRPAINDRKSPIRLQLERGEIIPREKERMRNKGDRMNPEQNVSTPDAKNINAMGEVNIAKMPNIDERKPKSTLCLYGPPGLSGMVKNASFPFGIITFRAIDCFPQVRKYPNAFKEFR